VVPYGIVDLIGKLYPVSMIGTVGAEIEIKTARPTPQIARPVEFISRELVSWSRSRLNLDTGRAKIQVSIPVSDV
jgi:hypothetical protein